MRQPKIAAVTASLIAALLAVWFFFPGVDHNQDEINPTLLRRYWEGGGDAAPVTAYILTAAVQETFKGTFGIDLSHYTFDKRNNDSACKTPAGYTKASCSCTADWQKVAESGIRFVYLKASDGVSTDLSFNRAWNELQPQHQSSALLRGAYHFLRPGVDVEKQAEVFLRAIGTTDRQRPAQLRPVLDIEWSNKKVLPGTSEFESCPAKRLVKRNETYYCDMWHQVPSAKIAEMAKTWAEIVERATGLPVMIYTNPVAWWNPIMTPAEDFLVKDRAIWTSRYTATGPKYNPNWTKQGGSPRWGMAPLPRGASFPSDSYTTPHLWQFTEEGYLSSDFLVCDGKSTKKSVDLNWIPVEQRNFPLFANN